MHPDQPKLPGVAVPESPAREILLGGSGVRRMRGARGADTVDGEHFTATPTSPSYSRAAVPECPTAIDGCIRA